MWEEPRTGRQVPAARRVDSFCLHAIRVATALPRKTYLCCNPMGRSRMSCPRPTRISRRITPISWKRRSIRQPGPTRNRDFGPRVGFAWDIFGNGRMAVRGGYGIYYDRIFDNIWSNGAWNPPFYGLADFENDLGDAISYANPASIGPGYDPSIPGCQIPNAKNANCAGHRVSVRTMDVNMKDASTQNYYFGVEHQFL